MDGTTAVFGVGCLLTVALAYCAEPDDRFDALMMAVILVGVWLAGIAGYTGGDLGGMAYVDLAVALLARIISAGQPWGNWRSIFFGLCGIQIGVNLAYGIWGNAVYDAYYWLINGSGALQLAVIGNTGVKNGWRNLRDSVHRHHPLRHA